MPLPNDDIGMAVTVWTARAVVAGWGGTILAARWLRSNEIDSRTARIWWTAGCAALAIHTLCAFLLVHHGSHRAAWEHTARRTAETTGVDWGGGLIINEVMLVWWIVDVAMLWRNPVPAWRRSPVYRGILHGTFAFLMLNATVVFGPPIWRWIGAVFVFLLVAGEFRRAK